LGILKIADIYVHSSVSGGGLSTSLLEAMLCGCAVLATPNEGADEVVENENNGLLLNNNSPEALSEKISYLCKNEQVRRELSCKSREKIEKNFGWKNAMNEYLKYIG
jgi:glycosyltransferase involved in cell wall biosynthesis